MHLSTAEAWVAIHALRKSAAGSAYKGEKHLTASLRKMREARLANALERRIQKDTL